MPVSKRRNSMRLPFEKASFILSEPKPKLPFGLCLRGLSFPTCKLEQCFSYGVVRFLRVVFFYALL
jgi:hypothetical protein